MANEFDIQDQAARLRALEVLSEQHRRITALAAAIRPAQRRALDAAAELNWRALSRAPFDERVAELGDRFVAVSAHIDDALTQCERAKAAALTSIATGNAEASGPREHSGYPATRPTLRQAPGFEPAR